VRDFLFVDAVSGAPLRREEKGYAPPSARRARRANLEIILVALVGFIILLASRAFS